MNNINYAVGSLELHLFFARIMKEHALFLKASLTPVNKSFAEKAEFFKNEFEKVLCQTVNMADGVIDKKVLCSGEIVTEFTPTAEKQTERFTGISINKEITRKEMTLCSSCRDERITREMVSRIKNLNCRALRLLDGLIYLKECILENVTSCKMFTTNYPLLLEHIIREAKLYRKYLRLLERDGCLREDTMRETECFWNRIMMEHSLFIRGLLDPSENELIFKANEFAGNFSELLKKCCTATDKTYEDSLEETKKLRDFKTAGAKGIEECKIRSVILPLLADHVLREANHYIRLLEEE